MVVADVMMGNRWASRATAEWLARLLCTEGVDIMTAEPHQFERGTPIYVRADADLVAVHRLMATNFMRVVPVVRDGAFVGILELRDMEPQHAETA